MAFNGLCQQATCIERCAIRRRYHANLTLRDERHLRDRDAEEIRMNRPQAGRQRAKLDAFDAAAFDEGNRVLKIVVRVLRAVGREVSAGGQRLAVNRFDDTEFVRADLDEWNFTHDALERPLDQMQSRL